MGIAEQNMTNVAAGLSLQGKIPWISTYAVFVAGRTWDQVRNTVCYGNLNVKFGACHGGISVGKDGPTHQSIEDLAITRVIPNMTIVIPADYHQTRKAVLAGNKHIGPYFMRMGREKVPVVTDPEDPFEIGNAITYLEGNDCYIICNGIMIHMALVAAKELRDKDGLSVGVVNMHTVKPIDRDRLIECAKKTGCIVTAEEHSVIGGLGGACAEVLSQAYPVPMRIIGVNDRYGESGPPEELLERWGLTSKEIADAVREVINMKK
jgi:transketolase